MCPKRTSIAAILLLFFPAQPTIVFGGRPLVVDDATAVAQADLEFELGFTGIRPRSGGRDQQWPVTAITYRVGGGLELGLGIQRLNQDIQGDPPLKGFEDLHLTAKYNFLAAAGYFPAAALSFDVKIPTANRSKGLTTGKSDQDLILILTESYTPVTFHVNLGYLIVDSPRGKQLKNRLRGGLAVEWQFHDRRGWVGEIFGATRESRGGSNDAEFQSGLRYHVTPRLTFDAPAGRSLRSAGN